MNNTKISVIVPVYNVDRYLKQCIESIEKQTFTDYEVILIDDGSTDSSGQICRSFCQKNDRIHYFRQENRGLSSARNLGVEKSRGQYVCFVDGDDWIDQDYLRVLYMNLMEFGADISICGYCDYPGGEEIGSNEPILMNKEQMLMDLSTTGPDNRSEYLVIACNKLYKRELVEKVPFPIGKWHEDEFTVHHFIALSNQVIVTPKTLYKYRRHDAGITGQKNSTDDRHLDFLDALDDRLAVFSYLIGSKLYKRMIISYIENGIILYLLQEDKYTQSKWKDIIFPKIKLKLKEYKKDLNFYILMKYRLFLIAPRLYRRIYWN